MAATAAVSLATAPTMAAATTGAELAPATESVEGSELGGGFIVPLLALVAIILGILAATGELDGDGDPPISA